MSFITYINLSLLMFPFLVHSCRAGIWSHPWRCEHTLPLIPNRNWPWEEYWGDPTNIPWEGNWSLKATDGHVPQRCHGMSHCLGSLPVWQAWCGYLWWFLVRVVPPCPTSLQGLWVEAQQGLERELFLGQWDLAAASSPGYREREEMEVKKKTCRYMFCQFF